MYLHQNTQQQNKVNKLNKVDIDKVAVNNSEKTKEGDKNTSSSTFSPQCHTNCMYFPMMPDIIEYQIDEKTGIKTSNRKFICGYDLHQITSWCDPCPRENDKKSKETL